MKTLRCFERNEVERGGVYSLSPSAGKAALKPPALQTLARGTERSSWREEFGVRAALAPLSFSREANPRFKGSKREVLFRRILISPSVEERSLGPRPTAICAPEPEKAKLSRVSVLECASPLALSTTHDFHSARGLAHSKTLRRYERFMGMFPCAFIRV